LGSCFCLNLKCGQWWFFILALEKTNNLFLRHQKYILPTVHAYWKCLIVIIGGYLEQQYGTTKAWSIHWSSSGY
jgi:hypothetical protein